MTSNNFTLNLSRDILLLFHDASCKEIKKVCCQFFVVQCKSIKNIKTKDYTLSNIFYFVKTKFLIDVINSTENKDFFLNELGKYLQNPYTIIAQYKVGDIELPTILNSDDIIVPNEMGVCFDIEFISLREQIEKKIVCTNNIFQIEKECMSIK